MGIIEVFNAAFTGEGVKAQRDTEGTSPCLKVVR
jgi:hypothetical protein